MSFIHRLEINLGPRSYPILIGGGVYESAWETLLPLFPRKKTIIVTDETVAALHLPRVAAVLKSISVTAETLILPAGEQTKSFAGFEQVTNALLAAGIERTDGVIALGGGVIGDLVGFGASVLRRGCAFVQIPTTLLAQVDSSVGGKTGINTPYGKNLVGSFHQPRLVLIDPGVIDTLPRRELLAGYAEIVKYGLIDDPAFFDWLEAYGTYLITGDTDKRTHAIATSCLAKARVVEQDEYETKGLRALLNFGHTFGHALEAQTGFSSQLLHGEAVALGMVMAFALSTQLGLCPQRDYDRMRAHLKQIGLPTSMHALGLKASGADLVGHMAQDKKMEAGRLAFILTRGIGKAFLSRDVALTDVASFLDRFSRMS